MTTPTIRQHSLMIAAILLISCTLTACQDASHQPVASTLDAAQDTSAVPSEAMEADQPIAHPITLANGRVQIDWSLIDTSVAPIDPAEYAYPFETNSSAVLNYAKAYDITAAQAQHSMMLSMASPEPLNKILDQLTKGRYLGHELRDGKDMTLIIHTDASVVAEHHDYVIADKFGEGLVLPIEIRPKTAQ